MSHSLSLSIVILVAITTAHNVSSEPVSASEGWFSVAGNQSAYEKLIKLEQADLIKRADKGFYDGFDSYNYYISSTTVGNLTTFTDSTLTNVAIKPLNCGVVSSQNALSGEDSNHMGVNSDACIGGGADD